MQTYTITAKLELANGTIREETLTGRTEDQITQIRQDYRAQTPTGSTTEVLVTREG